MALGLLLVVNVRPDPRRIAEALARAADPAPAAPAAPLREILRRPGVVPALLAAVASFAVMVSVMNLTGYVVLEHGHEHAAVFSIISAHFVGMFGLVLVVGRLIERLGHVPATAVGLLLTAASTVSLLWVESVWATGAAMFVLGLGWNFSYVAATAALVDLSAASERGKLLGFSDMASAACGALLAVGGGIALGESGVEALSAAATTVALVPVVLLAVRRFRYNAAPAGT
jgi:MFS family permease